MNDKYKIKIETWADESGEWFFGKGTCYVNGIRHKVDTSSYYSSGLREEIEEHIIKAIKIHIEEHRAKMGSYEVKEVVLDYSEVQDDLV